MELLIKELNDPANQSSSVRIQDIQRRIQHLQRQKSGWQCGLDLLQNDEPIVRFYGALTLTVKINADWEIDGLGEDKNARKVLLESIIDNYIRLSNIPDASFVLLKICSTLAAYFVKPSSGWFLPVRQILVSLMQGRYIGLELVEDFTPALRALTSTTFHQLRGIFWFASSLVEEVARLDTSSTSSAALVQRLIDNNDDVWQLIYACLRSFKTQIIDHTPLAVEKSGLILDLVEGQYVEVIEVLLSMIPSWLQYSTVNTSELAGDAKTSTEKLVKSCVSLIFDCFQHEALADLTIQTLTILAQTYPSHFGKPNTDAVAKITTSTQAAVWIENLEQGEFHPDAVRYVEFLVALVNLEDLSSPEYLMQDRSSNLLHTLQKLMQCDGVAVLEDPVCQLILECLSEVVEGYNDWDAEDLPNEVMNSFVRDICVSALTKAKFPIQEMDSATRTWDMDERSKFQDFRNDVHDFLLASFLSLGPPLIGILADSIIGNQSRTDWPAFETGLFGLDAFADIMENRSDQYDQMIQGIMATPQWAIVTQNSGNSLDRARQGAIRFISHNTAFLRRHLTMLVPCLDFLFFSLKVQGSSNVASRAIQMLCFSERSILVEALPQFMNSLKSMRSLGPTERHRIYSSVAAIVQAIPAEENKLEPLTSILDTISREAEVMQKNPGEEPQDMTACAIDLLKTLVAVGKGLRAPSDAAIDLEGTERSQAEFWTLGPGRSLQNRALSLCVNTMNITGLNANAEIVEAACDFVKSGYTEEDPSPFKFPLAVSVDFLTSQIHLENPNIDAVMACLSAFLSSTKVEILGPSFESLMTPVFDAYRLVYGTYRKTGFLPVTDFLSSSIGLITRLLPKWGSHWLSTPNTQESLNATAEVALLVLSAPDTLPRRSVASFFAAIFELTSSTKSLALLASENLAAMLQIFRPRIMALLLRLIAGDCARSEIEALTEPLKRLVQAQNAVTRNLLREAMQVEAGVLSPSALAATTIEQRLRFVAQIEALRGARKTGEVVRDFWLACRGGAYGYTT